MKVIKMHIKKRPVNFPDSGRKGRRGKGKFNKELSQALGLGSQVS